MLKRLNDTGTADVFACFDDAQPALSVECLFPQLSEKLTTSTGFRAVPHWAASRLISFAWEGSGNASTDIRLA